MELQEIDLNLLVVFNELLRQRRVSAVAASLGISQPAISNALNRLRKVLGDELFLRTSKGMVPTPFAETLAEPIGYALGTIHNTLNVTPEFDPVTTSRAFTIAMTDIGEIYFLPGLMKRLALEASGIKISTVRNQSDTLRDEMERGAVDLAIGFLPDLKTAFFQRRLFRQRYVCLFRKGHPFAEAGLTMKSFLNAEHVSIIAEGTGHGMVDTAIQRAGIQRNVRLRVPHFVAVGHILQTTDLVAVVPEAYANRTLAPFDLLSAPCPVKIPDITINVLWHARNHREPSNQWLRQLVFDEFAL
ncbi:LysR family transcriptional regulator [Caballeronia mineralivorans PML1(12)]|uniref:LysR family transcriptional regulator n=1 Tax=Caballeronia mineralivorans PML1(12) TaxID=908627 RepID=A0A0J1CWQ9_9BURK|nr:LysR family transcriptional regulator [Caballeronia mineralivorans]KLU24982.1 LysR family transcriptional regulator [Caballeronia mineralivorans PML1(12)]